MAKINFTNEVKWVALTVPMAGGFFYLAAVTLDTAGVHLPKDLIAASPYAGMALASGVWMAHKFGQIAPAGKPKMSEYSAQYRWGLENPEDLTRVIRWKDRPEMNEFIFWGQGLTVPIAEGTLLRFCQIAWRRQQNALYGSTLNMAWTDSSYRRLTANQIFSQAHFIRRTRPRFEKVEYDNCLYILRRTNLLLGRQQGKTGKLRFPPEHTVEIARERWLPPSPARRHTWNGFGWKYTN